MSQEEVVFEEVEKKEEGKNERKEYKKERKCEHHHHHHYNCPRRFLPWIGPLARKILEESSTSTTESTGSDDEKMVEISKAEYEEFIAWKEFITAKRKYMDIVRKHRCYGRRKCFPLSEEEYESDEGKEEKEIKPEEPKVEQEEENEDKQEDKKEEKECKKECGRKCEECPRRHHHHHCEPPHRCGFGFGPGRRFGQPDWCRCFGPPPCCRGMFHPPPPPPPNGPWNMGW